MKTNVYGVSRVIVSVTCSSRHIKISYPKLRDYFHRVIYFYFVNYIVTEKFENNGGGGGTVLRINQTSILLNKENTKA